MVTVATPTDQRIVLSNISWETYERLVADRIDQSSPRLTYDQGTLEIMSPGRDHERDNRALSLIVWTVATEQGVNFDHVGSMTYKRARLGRGFEADSTFYLIDEEQSELPIEIGSEEERPPDLVIEIDYSRSSLDKLALYAALRVPEVWRWDGAPATFYRLVRDQYQETKQSTILPMLTPDVVASFVVSNRSTTKPQWLRSVRAWARSQG